MAATNETSLSERSRGWFREPLTEDDKDTQPMRELLEVYSKIPPGDVISHINSIRERGFAAAAYPCIGLFRFTILTLATHPLYDTILETLKRPDATYIDIGCCFAQDLRKPVADGIDSEKLTGLDTAARLMELGYDLFQDRETLKSQFVIANVFEVEGSSQEEWKKLEEKKFDVLHCSAFFHLWPLEKQLEAAERIVSLVKVGGVIVGRQMGSVKPGDVPAIQEGKYSYRHNVDTLDEMWKRVGEKTGTSWKVEGTLDKVGIKDDSPVENKDSRRLLFTITRLT
ncbi:hypothetical protein F5Y17DRAFT_123274 [Xylariaceae sp. FL0594]|nr:hypothetical protein F5Y17DRAFT_123274 [Xylariaceae sp. FL0594]